MMKRFLLFTMLSLALLNPKMMAKDLTIPVSQLHGDLTTALRNAVAGYTQDDHVILDFDKPGTYTINGTVRFECNLEIKGQGRDNTAIILNKGNDRNGFKAFQSSGFLYVVGTINKNIKFSMHDIAIRLNKHNGIWFLDGAKNAIKITHANRVDVYRVDSYMYNAVINNFDLRVCSNVTVRDCNITNYNNTHDGGNLWFRGETHHVLVANNTFNKYGQDECLAFFGLTKDANGDKIGNITRSDIKVLDNTFNYGNSPNPKDKTLLMGMFFSFFSVEELDVKERLESENFEMARNVFNMNGRTFRTIYFSTRPQDSQKNFSIHDNVIVNTDDGYNATTKFTHVDFDIRDLSNSTRDTIFLTNNKITNHCEMVNSENSNGYTFLQIRGSNVCLDNNQIVNHVTESRVTGKQTGTNLIWVKETNSTILTMRNNVVKGLKQLAIVSASKGVENFTFNAFNNYFQGDTRIYCHNTQHFDLNFTGNTFKSNDANFFLQEFANEGSVKFELNDVYAPKGARLLQHWNNNINTHSFKFKRVDVTGNVFHGFDSETDLLRNMTNVKQRNVSSNIYKR